jgi:23S rRNA (guanine2445-N2)-methyltransferase / 23S rRNA (guanine2069-N7)-methyltransferase
MTHLSSDASKPLQSLEGSMTLLATCAFGLESVVVRELEQLGYAAKPVSTGRVAFEGDARAIARANLWLRTADRVLVQVHSWRCADFDSLFDTTRSIAWESFIAGEEAFPVDGRSVRSQLSSVPAVQRTVKKAIVERLQDKHARMLLPETLAPVRLEISILHDIATLTLDTSGVGLHKRGYRPVVGAAALKETLAAGLVMLSAWHPSRPLIDPFCGSGTIAIEAAMIARNIAPGMLRGFDCELWRAFPSAVWEAAREEAKAAPKGELGFTIHASDVDERAIALVRRAAAAAQVDRDIHCKVLAFSELQSKTGYGAEYGSIITNPPYGMRLGDDERELLTLYRSMPLVFKRFPTWNFHVLTGRLDLEDIVGQQATRRRKLYNSQIECTYFTFLGPKPPREVLATPHATAKRSDASLTEAAEDARVIRSEVEGIEDTTNDADAEAHASVAESAPRFSRPAQRDTPAFGGLRERDERELAQFEDRLVKNVRHLRKYPSRGITCYRVYERDCPDVPLIVDRYEDHVHVAEYEREHSRTFAQQTDWWQRATEAIARAFEVPLAHVHTKQKHRQRGLTQHEKISDEKQTIIAQEGGLRFEVNLTDYIDTGLFLDHRLTRGMFRDVARSLHGSARVLNLFCYTGAFTVYAAHGGCATSVSVDLSNTYLSWAERNLKLNGLLNSNHELVRADTIEFLAQHKPGPHFDLVICDPPTFSNSKSTEEDWQVAQSQGELFTRLRGLLAPGAVVFFSNNYRRFKLDEELVQRLGFSCREITKQTIPPEYRNDRIHRCWRMQLGSNQR